MTTRMRPGYLRKNGVPYSESARLEEYFDRFTEPNGDSWIVVDSIVIDPAIFTKPWTTSGTIQLSPGTALWEYLCVTSESEAFNEQKLRPQVGAK